MPKKPCPTKRSPYDLDAWKRDANYFCLLLAEVGADTLPDQPWAEWHASGMAPKDAARKALAAAGLKEVQQ